MSEIEIIYEDEFLLVVNKPAGLGTQAPRQFDSLESRVRTYLVASSAAAGTPYLGIPHRLDRCVSGVVVFAKRRKSAQRLARQFEHREVEKKYVAIVSGLLLSAHGTWRDYLRKIPDQPRAEIVPANHEDAKEAVLHYSVLSTDDRGSRLSIDLETGRMHQIRIQCASRGHPVLGDEAYGSLLPFGEPFEHDRDRWIALHASKLTLEHPRSRCRVTYEAPLPKCWSA